MLGPACPQDAPFAMPHLGPTRSEDCLRLNVYSPAADDARRPVMVWIHGGAFVAGSAAAFTGAHLAELGDIVVVGVNYRLGALGFLGIDQLGMPHNLGLRDQIAALRWVRGNIAAFGGDPERVTVAGESAGSLAVSLLMVCPEARGLFHGAILQSGAISLIHEQRLAERIAGRFMDVLGTGARDRERIRSMPVEQLLEAQRQVGARLTGVVPTAPCFDGGLLPASLDEARAAETPAVPLLAGFNRDETRLFERGPLRDVLPTRFADLDPLLERQLGQEHAARIRAAYPDDRSGERALATDLTFAMPTRHFAERHRDQGHPTWLYRFDREHPLLGAAHGLELTYLWEMPKLMGAAMRGGPLVGSRRALAARMRRHWVGLVRDGDPGGGWPQLDAAGTTLLLGKKVEVATDPDGARREAWAGADVAAAAGR
jgi:para-nitrobenzyl esterase